MSDQGWTYKGFRYAEILREQRAIRETGFGVLDRVIPPDSRTPERQAQVERMDLLEQVKEEWWPAYWAAHPEEKQRRDERAAAVREQHDREEQVARGVEAEPSRVNRTALVAYRCKAHGCLLGALVQVQGRRYQLWQQNTEVGHIDSADIEEWIDAALDGVALSPPGGINPDAVQKVLAESVVDQIDDYEKDGYAPPGVADWYPDSLSEWLQTVEGVTYASDRLSLNCKELTPGSIGWWGYGENMNCRHVEYALRDGEAEAEAERLRGKRNRVVYVDSRGPVKPRR
ncbi:hypothetical protein [Corynebacterium variabile]|uniref:hypothetical protein n=1 Tax=Corynebacterium variabile TaxID=1727 RepID=UPI0028ABA38A|nr:hypothetical protein [Corynebacterium variabile]